MPHLMQGGQWQRIVFVGIKDIAVVAILAYLARLIRTFPEMRLKILAVRSVMFALLVSFVCDAAITLIRV